MSKNSTASQFFLEINTLNDVSVASNAITMSAIFNFNPEEHYGISLPLNNSFYIRGRRNKMVHDLTIRNAIEGDEDDIYNIHTEAIKKKCSSHYGTEDVDVWVARQNKAKYLPSIAAREIVVAEKLGKVVGFGHLLDCKESDGKTMQIRGLFVDPDCGVKGVGSALMKEMEKRARDCSADCLIVQSSLNAVEFYRKCGFIPVELTTHQMSEQSCLQCHKMMKKL